MFLAARSLCMKAFLCRYSMPEATSLQNPSRRKGVSSGTSDPGLYNDDASEGEDVVVNFLCKTANCGPLHMPESLCNPHQNSPRQILKLEFAYKHTHKFALH